MKNNSIPERRKQQPTKGVQKIRYKKKYQKRIHLMTFHLLK